MPFIFEFTAYTVKKGWSQPSFFNSNNSLLIAYGIA